MQRDMDHPFVQADPQRPLFDPGGVFWRVNREMVLLLGGGAALLSQIAHPLVAAGVYEHSGFREQPLRRLYGTITAMQRMIYGARPVAFGAAERIQHIHRHIHGELTAGTAAFPIGTRYDACDPALLLWVHSTLVGSAVTTYEAFFPALTSAERQRYYQESKTIAHLVGLEDHQIPSGWADFEDYYRSMLESNVLEVTAMTRELAEHIIHPPVSWVPHVAGDVLSIATVALLPEPIRARYGLPWSDRRRQAWRFARGMLRRVLPYMPSVARIGPRVWQAERRLRAARVS